MPELPDVEVFTRYFRRTSLHRTIGDADVLDNGVLGRHSSRSLQQKLHGKYIDNTLRHGKYLFVLLGGGSWILMHFGMTGYLEYFKDRETMPEYTRVLLNFINGYSLAYVSKRKLGTFDWVDDAESWIRENGLGPDALEDVEDGGQLREMLGGTRGMIKPRLMDQSQIAGIGNIYSDEILFRAGIHPRSRIDAFSPDHWHTLYDSMQAVMKEAIECGADPGEMDDSFLIPSREDGAGCTRCGGTITKSRVSGRGTYFCPSHQEKVT